MNYSVQMLRGGKPRASWTPQWNTFRDGWDKKWKQVNNGNDNLPLQKHRGHWAPAFGTKPSGIVWATSFSYDTIKAGVNLNGIFAPLNTGLVQISRSNFKQSKNSMLKTWIYVIGCFVNFLVILGYIWVEIIFLERLEKFREKRKIEDLMKFKN